MSKMRGISEEVLEYVLKETGPDSRLSFDERLRQIFHLPDVKRNIRGVKDLYKLRTLYIGEYQEFNWREIDAQGLEYGRESFIQSLERQIKEKEGRGQVFKWTTYVEYTLVTRIQ